MATEAVIGKSVNKKNKGKSVIKTKSYIEATGDAATHLKTKTGSYELITSELVIYMHIEGETDKVVHYLDLSENPDATYYIKKKDENGQEENVKIETQLYSPLVVSMQQNEEGNYYRCTDGSYIHMDEIQIPAYKRVEVSRERKANVINGQLRIDEEVVKLADGTKYIVTEEAIGDGKIKHTINTDGTDVWEVKVGTEWKTGTLEGGIDSAKYVTHIQVGDKIVDIGTAFMDGGTAKTKLKTDVNGKVSVEVDGRDVTVGERDLSVSDRDFTAVFKVSEGSDSKQHYVPQVVRTGGSGRWIKLGFPLESNIREIEVSSGGGAVIFTYADGHTETYLAPGVTRADIKNGPTDKIFRMSTNASYTTGRDADGKDFYDITISGKAEVDKGDLTTIIEPNEIKDLEWVWDESNNYETIKSYKIGDVKISEITWEDDQVKSFTITNEDGSTVRVDDVSSSDEYKHLAIKRVAVRELTNVVFSESSVSFKLGGIEIQDAKFIRNDLTGEYSLGDCIIKVGANQYKTNLQRDSRFEKLNAEIAVRLSTDVIPLAPSKLLEKVDGKYQVVADVVQTGPMLTESQFAELSDEEKAKACGLTLEEYNSKTPEEQAKLHQNCVCGAHEVTTIDDALAQQQQFMEDPYKTVVIDNRNPDQVHRLDDFENKYLATSEFELDPSIMPDILPKHDKVEVIDGKVKIDPKRQSKGIMDITAAGFAITQMPFPVGFILGGIVLTAAVNLAIWAPIVRKIQEHKISNMKPEKVIRKMQKKAEKVCAANITKYSKELHRDLKKIKGLPPEQYAKEAAKLKQKYKARCDLEIANMESMAKGVLKVPFNLNGKTKLTNENVLGFLSAKQEENQVVTGPHKIVSARRRAYCEEMGLPLTAKINKEDYKRWKAEKKAENTAERKRTSTSRKTYREEMGIPKGKKITRKKYNQWKAAKKYILNSEEYIAEHGTLQQKLELFKHTDEYKNEKSRKKRAAMLRDKRNELLSESRQAKPLEFGERLDRNGNPSISKNVAFARNFVENVLETAGEKSPGELKFSDSTAVPTNTVQPERAQRVETTEQRNCKHDAITGMKALEKVETKINQATNMVERAKESAAGLAAENDFEKSYLTAARNSRIESAVNDRCDRVDGLAENAIFEELNTEKKNEVKTNTGNLRVEASKARKQAESACNGQREDYQKEVKTWARADYVAAHREEFKEFANRYLSEKEHRGMSADAVMVAFIEDSKTKGSTKEERRRARERVEEEMRTYQVVNNIEELVRASVVCSQERESYEAWINKYNTDNGTTLDVNSDLARSKYYAARVSDDIKVANQFDPTSTDFIESSMEACQVAAHKRAVDGSFETREDKQKKVERQGSIVENISKRAEIVERARETARRVRAKFGRG